MSPLNRGPLMGPRLPPAGVRQLPPPRFVGRLTPHGMPSLMLPRPPLNPMFNPTGLHQRPPPRTPAAAGVSRPNGMLPRCFPVGPRARGPRAPGPRTLGPRAPGPRAPMVVSPMRPRGPPMRPWVRRMPPPPPPPPPQMMPMRFRFGAGNGSAKGKGMGNSRKVKVEELELKKPWMTDEIRNEIQRKNKLYAKAKKNKDAVEWEEFKDLRNKVTRMIRDAKNDYLAKHPEQAHLYPVDEESYDQRDENYVSSDDDDDDDNDASNYCEVCDRAFPSKDAFSEHKSTHMVCGIDGCTFSAHPLLVDKHINMQHRTGLYQRIKDLSTPENIDKWIMERKKKYPTETNIKLREAEELEKLQRGEIIKQTSNVYTKTKKMVNTREKKRRPRKRRAREINNSVHVEETYRGLRPFPGLTVLEEDSAICLNEQMEQTDLHEEVIDNISDEDDVPQAPVAPEFTNSPIISLPVLTTLVADYGSEDDDEGPEEVPVKKMKMESQDDKRTENIIHEESSTQVSKETSNIRSYTNADNNKPNNKSQNTAAKRQNKQNSEINQILIRNKKILHRHHNKLLEKLLSRSIQHERNLICQCVKYIIENNFFD